MKDYILYIIRFLLGEDIPGDVIPAIGYTDDPRLYGKFSIVIRPSGFFSNEWYGKSASIPTPPLKSVENIPLLFGEDKEEMVGDTLVLYADIVASTFFLITRYEEMVRRGTRDEHGRFPGKESLPFRAGFIQRPIVEEYGVYLRNKLRQLGIRVPEEKHRIQRIYLTHDIDQPYYCRTFRNLVRELTQKQQLVRSLNYLFGELEKDPYYTFPWLFAENDRLRTALGKKRCKTICFFKAGGNSPKDKPVYKLTGRDTRSLLTLCDLFQVEVGLHSSYQAGMEPEQIVKEKKRLETYTGKKIKLNRHHFLTCREPEHFTFLQKAGIDQDFTMGYADVAGFRLGTCRPVRWINPATRRLSTFILHPLTVMDCTLSEEKYMQLSYDEAWAYCKGLIEQTANYSGDLTLLWHNTSVVEGQPGYLRRLYQELINQLMSV